MQEGVSKEFPKRMRVGEQAYPEVLDVGEDLVVEREVIAGNDINASILLDVPVLKTKPLGLGEEVGLRQLPAPVSFGGLLQVAVDTHSGETKDGAVRQSASRSYIEALYRESHTIEP